MTDRPKSEAALRQHIDDCPVSGSPNDRRAAFEMLAGPQPDLTSTRRADVPCREIGTGPEVLWFHGGGYVFNNPHNIHPGVPPENIVALFDAAYEYGAYV